MGKNKKDKFMNTSTYLADLHSIFRYNTSISRRYFILQKIYFGIDKGTRILNQVSQIKNSWP